MKMKNIRIEVKRENYIVVIADTARFGADEVMYEGNTFDQCFDYIKRETGRDKLNVSGYMVDGIYTDWQGRSFPCYMNVI